MSKKTGATPFKMTEEERYGISVLKASGMSDEAIALHKQITVEMLRASCAKELEAGAASRLAEVYLSLHQKALAGVVSAVNLFVQLAEKAELQKAQEGFTGQDQSEKEEKIGKKAQAEIDAGAAVEDPGWRGLLN